jgi:hypothetical protein
MASKSSLMAENRDLERLRANLLVVAERLYKANNDAHKIMTNLDRNYSLNNNSVAAYFETEKLAKKILDKRDKILSGLIPAIDREIESNKAEIREIERREEEERQAREQERLERMERLRRQSIG